jgi:hypothetical protein
MHTALLAVFLVAVVAELSVRVALDRQSPFADPAGHYLDSLRTLLSPEDSNLLVLKPSYTPFVSIAAIPFNLLFHFAYKPVLIATESVFLVMLLFATYGIGTRLFDRGTAFLAMVLLFTYPVVYGQSEMFMHDVPLSAMVTVTVWLALVSNGFRNPWCAAPIGLAIGFGMLTKFTYPLFVAAPLFALLLASLRNAPEESRRSSGPDPADHSAATVHGNRKSLLNAVIVAAVAIAVAGPWYLPRTGWLLGGRWAESANDQAAWNALNGSHTGQNLLPSGAYFARRLWVDTSPVMVVAVVVFGTMYLVYRGKGAVVLVSWIAVPAVLLGFMPVFEPRFFMPSLPAVALMTAGGLTLSIQQFPRIRAAVVGLFALAMAFSVFQLYAQSYGIAWLSPGVMINAVEGPNRHVELFSQQHSYVPRVTHPEFSVDKVSTALFEDMRAIGWTRATVGIFTDPVVRSALWMPILRHNLFSGQTSYLRLIDDPVGQRIVVDYVVRIEPVDRDVVGADRYLASLKPGVRYMPVSRFDIGFSDAGPWITIYHRVH